jgi:hypothetical protein
MFQTNDSGRSVAPGKVISVDHRLFKRNSIPLGEITFPVTAGDVIRERTVLIDFLIIPARSEYNMILGRTTLGELAAGVSTAHGLMMIPTPHEVAKV